MNRRFFITSLLAGLFPISGCDSKPHYGKCNYCKTTFKTSGVFHRRYLCEKCGEGEIYFPPVDSDLWKKYKKEWGD